MIFISYLLVEVASLQSALQPKYYYGPLGRGAAVVRLLSRRN